jgi:excisionase family DNA binding protein
MNDDHYLTVREVAALFQISTRTVYQKVRSGSWPHRQADKGHGIRFSTAHVDAIKQLGEKQPAKPKSRIRDLYRKGLAA